VDERLDHARQAYEDAVFGGDPGGLPGAERDLDAVDGSGKSLMLKVTSTSAFVLTAATRTCHSFPSDRKLARKTSSRA
jgi:hypothetical protein